jgi:hypothetical protein
MTLEKLLASTDKRKSRWGIKRASAYVNSFSGCLNGGACPSSLLGVSGEQWAECMKRAAESAVYANPAMVVKSHSESDMPDGAILTFDCVMTTTRKDRDGDILESSGVTIDPDMPLLWQHLPMQPIGKLVKELGRTKRMVQTRGAIADTPLGRDAAVLTKFGALRISHGFMPEEFEPLYNEKDQREGWHIKRLYVFEKSLVSIPSNVEARILSSVSASKAFAQELDGIRTAYGQGLLKTDAVKQWAKHFHENRPVIGKGVDLETLAGTIATPQSVVVNVYNTAEPTVVTETTADVQKHACTCQTKDGLANKEVGGAKDGAAVATKDVVVNHKMYGEYYVAGSFEAVQCALHRSLRRHLLSCGDCCCEHSYPYIVATYPDYAIVCVEDYPRSACYRMAYTMDGEMAVWSGEPTPVTIELTAEVVDSAKSRNEGWAEKRASAEQKCFSELVKDYDRARTFRDRLNVLLEADRTHQEWADTDALDELLVATV